MCTCDCMLCEKCGWLWAFTRMFVLSCFQAEFLLIFTLSWFKGVSNRFYTVYSSSPCDNCCRISYLVLQEALKSLGKTTTSNNIVVITAWVWSSSQKECESSDQGCFTGVRVDQPDLSPQYCVSAGECPAAPALMLVQGEKNLWLVCIYLNQ